MSNYGLKYHFERINIGENECGSRGLAIEELCHVINKLEPTVEKILVIDSVRIPVRYRNRGIGSGLLRKVCDSYDDTIIFVISGAHADEYTKEPTKEEYTTALNHLNHFYTKNGFVSVNEYIGGYQFKETFIYKNTASKHLLKRLCRD